MKILNFLVIGLLGLPFATGATQVNRVTIASDAANEISFMQNSKAAGKQLLLSTVNDIHTGPQTFPNDIDHNDLQPLADEYGIQVAHHGRWRHDDRQWRERRYHDKRRRYDNHYHKRHYRSHFKHYRDRPKYYNKHHKKHHRKHDGYRYWNGRHWTKCRPGSRHPKCLWRYPYQGHDRSGFFFQYRH